MRRQITEDLRGKFFKKVHPLSYLMGHMVHMVHVTHETTIMGHMVPLVHVTHETNLLEVL